MRRILPWVLTVSALTAAETVRTPYLGVTLHEREGIWVVRIDLTTPGLRFALSPQAGSREAIRQTTVEYLKSTGASLALNAHFFEPFPSEESECYLIGLAIADGTRYSEFERPRQSYALVPNAPALAIGEDNRASIVREGFGGKILVAVAGSAQVLTGGQVTIPVYGRDLTPGGPAGYGAEKSWYDVPTARTLIGLSGDRRYLVMLVARRMKVGDAAVLLATDFGVSDALNLDGGGSTTLALREPETGEIRALTGGTRAVCSSLAVWAPAK